MKFRISLLAMTFAWFAALAQPALADPYKTSFGPTTLDISTGHAGHSSIPKKMGYWAAENVDVDVFGVAGTIAGAQMLAAGKIDFISISAEGLMLAQAQGMPITAVYVHARSPISRFVVLKSSNIKSLKDLAGKTIGQPVLEASNGYFNGLFGESGLKFNKDIKLIATGTGAPAALALQRGDIAGWASWDTAVAGLENRGLQFTEFRPSYFDDLIGNVSATRNDMIEKHPDVVIGVVRGIAKAVHFGLSNPDAAVKIHWEVYPQTKPQTADAAEALKDAKVVFISRFASFKVPPGGLYGASRPNQWNKLAELMREAGSPLPAGYDPAKAFTDRFIVDINKFDRGAVEAQAKNWKDAAP
jgi:NitT/TauT family transport system substrate-binding protein